MIFHKEVNQRFHCSLVDLVDWLFDHSVGRSVGFISLLVAGLVGGLSGVFELAGGWLSWMLGWLFLTVELVAWVVCCGWFSIG